MLFHSRRPDRCRTAPPSRIVYADGRTNAAEKRRQSMSAHHLSSRIEHAPKAATRFDERGITTAEYAVGTAAGAGLAGLLFKLLTGGFGDRLLKTLFDHVLGLLGIG
jgi:hypothetical protein